MKQGTGNVQLVIPMAGLGTRFSESGYLTPKPLLPIHGIPMYRIVATNLINECVKSVTFIARKDWDLGNEMADLNNRIQQSVNLIEIDYITDGPASTVEIAREFLDPECPVVTGNSDQYVDACLLSFYAGLSNDGISGSILTMQDSDPKWSYALTNTDGDAVEVREKEVISKHATVGIYGFSAASLMFEGFDRMRQSGDTVRGEYYVAPSYNHVIALGHRITTVDLGPISQVMYGLGIPEDYEAFLQNDVSNRAASRAHSLGI